MEVIDHMDVKPMGLGVTIGQVLLHQMGEKPPKNDGDTTEIVYDDREDDFGEEQYELLNQIEVDDHGAITRARNVEYGYGLYSHVITYSTDHLGQVAHFNARPRAKREYRMSARSWCVKDEAFRDYGPGRTNICEQQPTTKANRQKCAGDKPRFRTGRRMARREIVKMEGAMCTG